MLATELEHGSPNSLLEEPPFEKRGFFIIETPKRKSIFIPPFTQTEIDAIASARSDREFLNSKPGEGIHAAKAIYANTHFPWGYALLDRPKAIESINQSLVKIDNIMKHRNTFKHPAFFGVLNYIKATLQPFVLSN